MTLRDSIAALVTAAPPDATVPVRWLGELLAAEANTGDGAGGEDTATTIAVDLTVAEVAARFKRGVSTVRTWLARDELPGAYRNHGREWRIPLGAVEAMQRAEAKRHAQQPRTPKRETVSLSDWRDHLPSKSA